MSIVCPQCNTPVPDTLLNQEIANCAKCGHQFEIANLNETRKKTEPLLPKGIRKFKDGDKIVILRSWNRGQGIYYLCFCIPLLALTVFIIRYVLSEFWHLNIVLAIFYVLVLAIFYVVLAMGIVDAMRNILNTSYLEFDSDTIRITHKPISFGSKSFNSNHLLQAYVNRDIENRVFVYNVVLMLRTGKREKLLEGLPYANQAQYIVQQIEDYFEIEHQPLREEDVESTTQTSSSKRQTKYKF